MTAVISMGRSLKLRVVAEGVETLEELAFLQAHHCDEAQGYYFSRPVPAAAVREAARDRNCGRARRRHLADWEGRAFSICAVNVSDSALSAARRRREPGARGRQSSSRRAYA